MTDQLTPEREAELRETISDGLWCGSPRVPQLLAALTAERAAHAVTRGEVERLKHSYPVCKEHIAEAIDGIIEGGHCYCCERDEARRDAVAAWDSLHSLSVVDVSCPVELTWTSPTGLGDRIDTYRTATSPPKPAPPTEGASR